MPVNHPFAFALGGLAGNNFHGAGLLEAAIVFGRVPDAISCTSAQIYWVYEYLRARRSGTTLRPIIEQELAKIEPTRWPDANFWNMLFPVFGGKPHEKFRPAFPEWFLNYGTNFAQMVSHLSEETMAALRELTQDQHPVHVFYLKQMLNTLPAQLLVPKMVLDTDKLTDVARELNAATIPIIFNSYDPVTGAEHIYLNDTAMSRPGKRPKDHSSYRSHRGASAATTGYSGDGVTRVYQNMDADAVREALWLYEYGFHGSRAFLDGAYLRGIILSELTKFANLIFVARPINHKWLGQLPRTFIERSDLETEVFFNGSYFGELDRIMLINKLLASRILPSKPASPFEHIDVVPIEIDKQRGFFDYVFEDIDVFEGSFNASRMELDC
jgi:hypothetical protein